MFKGNRFSRPLLTAASSLALLLACATAADAQQTTTQTSSTQTQPQQATPAQTTQAGASQISGAQAAPTSADETAAAKASVEPIYREYRGVTLGMSAADVRAKLGKPVEKSDEMDFFVFSERERARVYYRDGKASAVIATYIGRDAAAPSPLMVLGTEIEAKPDGSMYQMTPYTQAGYWVAYSRTPGDSPLVIITMQKSP